MPFGFPFPSFSGTAGETLKDDPIGLHKSAHWPPPLPPRRTFEEPPPAHDSDTSRFVFLAASVALVTLAACTVILCWRCSSRRRVRRRPRHERDPPLLGGRDIAAAAAMCRFNQWGRFPQHLADPFGGPEYPVRRPRRRTVDDFEDSSSDESGTRDGEPTLQPHGPLPIEWYEWDVKRVAAPRELRRAAPSHRQRK